MPNHYTTLALCSSTYEFHEHFGLDRFNREHGSTNWCDLIFPMPEGYENDRYCDWAREHWGTKWGTYNTGAYQLGGDGSPIAIEFQTAWGPTRLLAAIAMTWRDMFGFGSVAFMGNDPYDDRTYSLAVCQLSGLPSKFLESLPAEASR